MARPDKDKVRIVTEALRDEALKWAWLGDAMGTVESYVRNSLGLTVDAFFVGDDEAGQQLASKYAELQNRIARLTGEASVEWVEISGALMRVEDRYARTDEDAAQSLKSIYHN